MAMMPFVNSAKDSPTDLKTFFVEECWVFVLGGRLSALLEFLPEGVAEGIPRNGVDERRYL